MKAQESFNQLDPNRWAKYPVIERLALLEQVQINLKTYAEETWKGRCQNEK